MVEKPGYLRSLTAGWTILSSTDMSVGLKEKRLRDGSPAFPLVPDRQFFPKRGWGQTASCRSRQRRLVLTFSYQSNQPVESR